MAVVSFLIAVASFLVAVASFLIAYSIAASFIAARGITTSFLVAAAVISRAALSITRRKLLDIATTAYNNLEEYAAARGIRDREYIRFLRSSGLVYL